MIADYAVTVREAGKEYSPLSLPIISRPGERIQPVLSRLLYPSRRECGDQTIPSGIIANVAKIVKSGMSLLGIEVPERM